jgi:hypothetical protein
MLISNRARNTDRQGTISGSFIPVSEIARWAMKAGTSMMSILAA